MGATDENILSTTISLGPYKQGELPLPLPVRFDDADGTQLDISSGYTAQAYWRARTAAATTATAVTTVTIDVSESALGYANVTWEAAMVDTPGAYFLEVWVGTAGGTAVLASRTFTYFVEHSIVSPTPTF